MEIKIGRHIYEITSEDVFMDNGACVQLLTQSKLRGDWGKTINPLLSKKLVKDLDKFIRVQKKHRYGSTVQIFSLTI